MRPVGKRLSKDEIAEIENFIREHPYMTTTDIVRANPGWPFRSVSMIRLRALAGLRSASMPGASPPEGFAVSSSRETLKADGTVASRSYDYRPEPGPAHERPPDAALQRSTVRVKLVDGDERVSEVYYKYRHGVTPTAIAEIFRDVFSSYEPPELPRAPEALEQDMLSLYPLPDLHVGLLTWGEEVGHSFDLKAAVREYSELFARLVAASPPSRRCCVVYLGDTIHSNDNTNRTPRGQNPLDVDGRYDKVIRETTSLVKKHFDTLLSKHELVTAYVIKGNHDPESSVALHNGLFEAYRGSPRVTVMSRAMDRAYLSFGVNLMAFAHGDKAKPKDIAAAMPVDMPELWAKSTTRRAYLGHRHRSMSETIGGVVVETLPSPAPSDAYASSHGWRSLRAMHAIHFHREQGQIGRHEATVPTGLFKSVHIV